MKTKSTNQIIIYGDREKARNISPKRISGIYEK